jgi:hypothetical protein
MHPKIDFYFWTRSIGTCQKSLERDQKKKGYEITEKSPKSLIFIHPKTAQIFVDHNWAHEEMVENHPKSNKVTLKATKNFTKAIAFRHPNIAFHFWTKPISPCKNH